MNPEIVAQDWNEKTETGYRIEKSLAMTRRVVLEKRDTILMQFKADLLTEAIKNWNKFVEQGESVDTLWKFFDLKRKMYSKTNLDYFILKRAYPAWTVNEQESIVNGILHKMTETPTLFQKLYEVMNARGMLNMMPDLLLWGFHQAVHPGYYLECAYCLRVSSQDTHCCGAQRDDEMGFDETKKHEVCFCEKNLAVFVPCGHAVCAKSCYDAVKENQECLLCKSKISRVFLTKDAKVPPSVAQILN